MHAVIVESIFLDVFRTQFLKREPGSSGKHIANFFLGVCMAEGRRGSKKDGDIRGIPRHQMFSDSLQFRTICDKFHAAAKTFFTAAEASGYQKGIIGMCSSLIKTFALQGGGEIQFACR